MWTPISIGLVVLAAAAWITPTAADLPEFPKLTFTSCALPGWSCTNASDGLASTISSVTYQCSTNNYENRYKSFTLDLTDWEKKPLTSFTCRNCEQILLKMHTANPANISTLILERIDTLHIRRPLQELTYHPQNIVIRNIGSIPIMPTDFINNNGTHEIEFQNVAIGELQKKAISARSLAYFKWINVRTTAMKEKSLFIVMDQQALFQMTEATFEHLRPRSMFIKAGAVVIKNSNFESLQEASIRIIADSFNFKRNKVTYSKGPMYVTSPDVSFEGNTFSEDGDMQSVMNWTYQTNRDPTAEQITLSFVNNVFETRDDRNSYYQNCTSEVMYLTTKSNCTAVSSKPESWISETDEDTTVMVNVLSCGNLCNVDRVCTLDHLWIPLMSMGPKPLCDAPNNVTLTPFPTSAYNVIID